MPKVLVHPNDKACRIHPFKLMYSYCFTSILTKRKIICEQLNWSERTFYRKVSNEDNLTKNESEIISMVLGINATEIENFQHGFAKTKTSAE